MVAQIAAMEAGSFHSDKSPAAAAAKPVDKPAAKPAKSRSKSIFAPKHEIKAKRDSIALEEADGRDEQESPNNSGQEESEDDLPLKPAATSLQGVVNAAKSSGNRKSNKADKHDTSLEDVDGGGIDNGTRSNKRGVQRSVSRLCE